MKALRIVTGVVASLIGNFFLAGAAYVLGNHLFEWSVDKVAVEWQTTLFFAALYTAIGIIPVIVAAMWLQAVGRALSLVITSACVVTSWLFLSLLTYRMNVAYLWLVVGLPLVIIGGTVRAFQHRRTTRAA